MTNRHSHLPTTNRHSTFRVLVVLVVTVVLVASPVASRTVDTSARAVDDPQTAGEFLQTFRSLNGSSAMQTYSEFEIVRSQAILEIQVGNFTRTDRRRMGLVLELFRTFRQSFQYKRNESYREALKAANETARVVRTLQGVKGGQQYAVLADLALERYYDRTSQTLLEQAEGQPSTPERIRLLRLAATAAKRSGNVNRYSQLLVRVDTVETRFERDRSRMNESAAAASAFAADCEECTAATDALTYGLGVFPRYQRAIEASRNATVATDLAAKHGLTEREQQFSSLSTTVSGMQSSLAVASALLIVGYLAALGVVAAAVVWRLMLWRRDLHASSRGDVVLVGEMLDA